jgi:hypothetical protein
MTDEQQIRNLIERWAAAVHEGQRLCGAGGAVPRAALMS